MPKKVFQHFWKKENQIGRINKMSSDELIKKTLESTKTIAMVGVSSVKKEVSTNIRRRPSTIVMKYMQEFGYKVIPVNPFSVGEKVHGETIVGKLNDIKIPIDIVDVFRPSKEAPMIAEESVKIGAKVFWLQYGIQSDEAKKIVESKKIFYVSNKCIKQEYQKLFLKISPVFPALKTNQNLIKMMTVDEKLVQNDPPQEKIKFILELFNSNKCTESTDPSHLYIKQYE